MKKQTNSIQTNYEENVGYIKNCVLSLASNSISMICETEMHLPFLHFGAKIKMHGKYV